jgi:hypothetical protein
MNTIHCCEMMMSNLAGGETAIRYWPKVREYGIPVVDGGDSVILIAHCPWCGESLPKSLREEWFRVLEAKGFEPGDIRIPGELESDEWWIRRDK